MLIDDNLQIPEHLIEQLDQYRKKVQMLTSSYVQYQVRSTIDPKDPQHAGISSKFITEVTEDIPAAQHAKIDVLWKPGKRLQEQCIQWAEQFTDQAAINQWVSGHFLYPEDQGFMGWHTNSDQPGTIIYLVHTDLPNQSFFRYYDNQQHRIVTSYDKGGWHGRLFTTSSDPADLFWHCVYSETTRLSIGIEQQ